MLMLLFSHLFADVILQGNSWLAQKDEVLEILLVHCYLYAGTIAVCLMLQGKYALWKFWFILIGHFATDWWKSVNRQKHRYPDLVDQLLHFLQLLVVCYC